MSLSLLSISLVALLTAQSAFAGDEPKQESPPVKVSGIIFFHYGYFLDAEGYNEFAVDRGYLSAQGTLPKGFSTRLTLDFDHMKPVETDTGSFVYDSKYRVFMKHAYLEWKDGEVTVRAGAFDTPYAPFMDKFWGHRYISESFARTNKLVETADLGVGALGTHSGGLIDWHLGVYNGEGYGGLEVDGGKSAQARLTVDPMAAPDAYALPITGFVSYSAHPTTEEATLTYAGALGFKMKNLWFLGEYLGTSTGDLKSGGFAITAIPRMPKYGNVVLRYGRFDPDQDTEGDSEDQLIAGVSHDFLEKVSLALTYESAIPEEGDPESAVFLRMQAGF